MLGMFVIILLIVAISVALLGIRVFFVKGGKFPHTDISGNEEMEKRGIACIREQEAEMRRASALAVAERE